MLISVALRSCVLGGVCVTAALSAAARSPELRFYGVAGQPAPGTPHTFFRIANGLPTVSQAGVVMVPAEAGGQQGGLWTVRPRVSPELSLWGFGPLPIQGAPIGQTWRPAPLTGMDDQGRTVGTLTGDLTFVGHPHDLAAAMQRGMPAPGVTGGFMSNGLIGHGGMNRGGTALLAAHVTLSSQGGDGVWTMAPGGPVEPVAVPRMQAPGMPEGVVFAGVQASAINSGALTAFGGQIRGPGIGSFNDDIVGRGRAGDVSILLHQGDVLAPGIVFDRAVGTPALNDAGDVAIWTSADNGTMQTISLLGSGQPTVLARTGENGPGMQPGEEWEYQSGHVFWHPVVNATGQVGFWGRIGMPGGGEGSGIWLGDESDVRLVARSGMPVESHPGVSLGGVSQEFTLNAAGDVLTTARLAGLGVISDNDDAIVWARPGGAVEMLLREGQLLEVAPAEFKEVRTFDFMPHSGGSDGRMMSLNDGRVFAALVNFTDGTNAVVVTVLPAPASAGLGLLAIGVLGARGRRH